MFRGSFATALPTPCQLLMPSKTVKTLISAERISGRVREIGQEIAEQTTDSLTHTPLTVLGVMTGGLLFLADLVRAIPVPLQLGVLHARSYTGTKSGLLQLHLETLPDVRGRNVLVVDDIFDTGQTLTRIVDARLLIVRVRAVLPEEGARPHKLALVTPREPAQADEPGNRLDWLQVVVVVRTRTSRRRPRRPGRDTQRRPCCRT